MPLQGQYVNVSWFKQTYISKLIWEVKQIIMRKKWFNVNFEELTYVRFCSTMTTNVHGFENNGLPTQSPAASAAFSSFRKQIHLALYAYIPYATCWLLLGPFWVGPSCAVTGVYRVYWTRHILRFSNPRQKSRVKADIYRHISRNDRFWFWILLKSRFTGIYPEIYAGKPLYCKCIYGCWCVAGYQLLDI